MKQTVLALLLIVTGASSFSQTVSTNTTTKDYYLSKSKHQKTVGWIMLGGGVALTGVGIAVAQAETTGYALGGSSNSSAGAVLIVIGVASALGSIPLFISAGNNKRKAATVSFNLQKVPALCTAGNRSALFQPALLLKMQL